MRFGCSEKLCIVHYFLIISIATLTFSIVPQMTSDATKHSHYLDSQAHTMVEDLQLSWKISSSVIFALDHFIALVECLEHSVGVSNTVESGKILG